MISCENISRLSHVTVDGDVAMELTEYIIFALCTNMIKSTIICLFVDYLAPGMPLTIKRIYSKTFVVMSIYLNYCFI